MLTISSECYGSPEKAIINSAQCRSRCGMLMNPCWSMAISAEHMSKFAALHQKCLLLQMSEKFSSGTKLETNN